MDRRNFILSTLALLLLSDSKAWGSLMASDPKTLLDQAVYEALQTNRIVGASGSYVVDNPVEAKAVIAYLKGGVRPSSVVSHMGRMLVDVEDARRGLTVAVPPPSNVIAFDPCTDSNFESIWGDSSDALQIPGRCTLVEGFRRVSIRNGDNPDGYGERAQIGRNAWNAPTFCVCHEGDHRILTWQARYPASFPRNISNWQQLLQFKQAQPYVNDENYGDNDKTQGVSLEVQVINGKIQLHTWWKSRLPSLAMPLPDYVADHKLDVVFSKDSTKGRVALTVAGQTVSWTGATMAYEKSTGITIPSALMMGIYRDANVSGDTYVDIKNAKVVN